MHLFKKSKGIDNKRIEDLMYLYGRTSIYADLIKSCQSKQEFTAIHNILYTNHFKQEKNSLLSIAKKKNGHTFKVPELEGIKIRYEKKIVSGIKTKVEFHYNQEDLFYIHLVCSDLAEDKKKEMAQHYADKYLDGRASFDYQEHNIVDSEGLMISFCNIFNYSINDFSIDFIIDKDKFIV